ncbi:glycosyltransferase family protein [Pengzhenrongella sicca]|uniref:DUF6311 domain-containing protein n=1 Tax=Pengzhenrongella sicca TaxID=2819238 RepID=A0A8A4ZH06_9MICO|nr:hypothetical protein [Pengzhenrongella sicca]QTE30243.1 hypothetical protein J4E96_04345 [Pengzhenrongella sicca]
MKQSAVEVGAESGRSGRQAVGSAGRPLASGAARRSGGSLPWWRSEPVLYLLSAVGSALATVGALQLWRADLRVPFVYWGDAVAIAAHFKTVLETGWYEFQPLLGAPTGQIYHDFPTADNLNFVAARVLGWFTTDFATAMNVYYLAGFVLAALTMTWFLRVCGVSRMFTVVMAVLFSIAPYHFARGEGHLWLASYYAIPLALVVVLRALRGERLWGARDGLPRAVGLLTGRGASTALSVALVATASSYYAIFIVILLATAGIAAWWRDRDIRRFLGAATAGVLLVLVVAANMAPDLLYTMQHGDNTEGLVRNQGEVEIYALKLSQLLLPVPGHRIAFLAQIRSYYDSEYPLISENPALGAVAAFGLACALVLAVLAITRARRVDRLRVDQHERTKTLAELSMLTLVALLCSTVGGLASLLSFLTSDLRGWNRMSIVIAALCLAIAGLVLDAWLVSALRARQASHLRVRLVAGTVAIVVLAGGTFDQVTPGAVPDYAGSAAAYAKDETWIASVEDALPTDAMVFQLPYAGYPETGPVNGVYDTEQLKPYLHSAALRWSAGGIKGRATSDWPRAAAQLPASDMVSALAAEGFAAIMVDRTALGLAAPDLEAGLVANAGDPILQSADARYALYSLLDEGASVRALNSSADVDRVAQALVGPVMAYPAPTMTVVASTGAADSSGVALPVVWVSTAAGGSLTLDNPRGAPVQIELHAELSPTPGVGQEKVSEVGVAVAGVTLREPIVAGAGALDLTLMLPAGRSVLQLDAAASVTVTGFQVTELGLPVLRR